jgi:hypothetical protein
VHLKKVREIEVSVIQVMRPGAEGSSRDPKVSWLVWKSDEAAPLAQISPDYRLRYCHEHGFRFEKQMLMWDKPRFRTPEQTERWSQIVACAHNQLLAARPLVAPVSRAWERRRRAVTLAQVRRGCQHFWSSWGPLLDPHNHAEKHRDVPRGCIRSPHHATQSFSKQSSRAKKPPQPEFWRLVLVR